MNEQDIRADERKRCARIARMVSESCPVVIHEGALLVERELLSVDQVNRQIRSNTMPEVVSWWPPHQCFEVSQFGRKNKNRKLVTTRHYFFGFLIYDRTYLIRSDNGFRICIDPKAAQKILDPK